MKRGLVAAGALVLSAASQAAITVDTAVITTDATAAVAAVGAAVFALAVGIKVYKWIRSAL
ncbi:MAG: methyltransferase [Oxalobacteraceae bacterium]|nr:MAG: methyltransferase [Oxalobacteraceae bacterium]